MIPATEIVAQMNEGGYLGMAPTGPHGWVSSGTHLKIYDWPNGHVLPGLPIRGSSSAIFGDVDVAREEGRIQGKSSAGGLEKGGFRVGAISLLHLMIGAYRDLELINTNIRVQYGWRMRARRRQWLKMPTVAT